MSRRWLLAHPRQLLVVSADRGGLTKLAYLKIWEIFSVYFGEHNEIMP